LVAEAVWAYSDLLGYLESWSATQGYLRALGRDPVDTVRDDLERAWAGEPERQVRWPLVVRIGM
jgi:hypothetical protein